MIPLDAAFRIKRIDKLKYKALIDPDHCNRTVAHGGLLISLIQLALEDAFMKDFTTVNHPHLSDLHSSLLRVTRAGVGLIHLREPKLGAVSSTVFFDLVQNSKTSVTGFATHTNLTQPHPTLFVVPYKNPPALTPAPSNPPDFTLLESNNDPNWTRSLYHEDSDLPLRVLPLIHWYFSTPSFSAKSVGKVPDHGPHIIDFWISAAEPGRHWHTSELGFIVDLAPRQVESIRPDHESSNQFIVNVINRGIKQRLGQGDESEPLYLDPIAYPTTSISLEIKRPLPEEGVRWLYLRSTMQWYHNGMFDVEVVICNQSMDVVAVSRQMNMAIDLERARNLAWNEGQARTKGGTEGSKRKSQKL